MTEARTLSASPIRTRQPGERLTAAERRFCAHLNKATGELIAALSCVHDVEEAEHVQRGLLSAAQRLTEAGEIHNLETFDDALAVSVLASVSGAICASIAGLYDEGEAAL